MTHHTPTTEFVAGPFALDLIETLQAERDKLREVNADLLAALERAAKQLHGAGLNFGSGYGADASVALHQHFVDAKNKARAAIDKATATGGNSQ